MYNNIISNALKNSQKGNSLKLGADSSTYGGSQSLQSRLDRSGHRPQVARSGQITLGPASIYSSSSTRSDLPHLVPQKTNVLTGATTSYFANQASAWRSDYHELVGFQKSQLQEKKDKIKSKENAILSSRPPRHRSTHKEHNISLPLRGRPLYLGDKLSEMHERANFMGKMFEETQAKQQAVSIQMLLDEERYAQHNNAIRMSYEVDPKN